MGLNGVVDNSASQQMSIALSNGAVNDMKSVDRQSTLKDKDYQVKTETEIGRLVKENKSSGKAGMDVLINLTGKLATLGINLNPEKFSGKANDAMENELKQMLGGPGKYDDLVDLKNIIAKTSGKKGGQGEQEQQQNNSQGKSGLSLDKETQIQVREYAAVYAAYTVSHTPELKKKLVKLETELRSKGLGEKEFISIKTATSNSVRSELAQQIRDTFMKKVLSRTKSIDKLMGDKGLSDLFDFAIKSGVLDKRGAKMMMSEILKETAGEVRDFAKTKIEEKLMQQQLTTDPSQGKKGVTEIKELLELAAKAGVNLNEFTQSWNLKKVHLGLNPFNASIGQGAPGGQSGADQQQNKDQYEYTKDDEKDLLTNRLRALHMHRALAGDWKSMMETHFKVRRLKNGLIALGVGSNELEKIEKEGRQIACIRLGEMLFGVLEERATLYELAGPAFRLIEQKIKGLINNLKRLDYDLSEVEFNSLRDKANIKVFDAAREELLTLRDLVRTKKSSPATDKRYTLVKKLLTRLKEESNLFMELPDEEPSQVQEAV
ncbi:MAG: hypothetical protein ABIH50_06635 [bacterium]